MLDAFNNATKVIKSHILATIGHVPTRIDVPVGKNNVVANDLYVTLPEAWQTLRFRRFSHSKEEEYDTTELLHSRSITVDMPEA